jgi:hypothetical protein
MKPEGAKPNKVCTVCFAENMEKMPMGDVVDKEEFASKIKASMTNPRSMEATLGKIMTRIQENGSKEWDRKACVNLDDAVATYRQDRAVYLAGLKLLDLLVISRKHAYAFYKTGCRMAAVTCFLFKNDDEIQSLARRITDKIESEEWYLNSDFEDYSDSEDEDRPYDSDGESGDDFIRCGDCWSGHYWPAKKCRHCKKRLLWDCVSDEEK